MFRIGPALSLFVLLFLCGAVTAASDEVVTRYPGIPRIDVHSHPGSDRETIETYLGVRHLLLKERQCDLALWINLGTGEDSLEDLDTVEKMGEGRLLCCISDYSSHDGLKYPPDELQGWLDRGYVGYKIWAGPPGRRLKPGEKGFPYIDDVALDPTFAQMEAIGMVGASIHIADRILRPRPLRHRYWPPPPRRYRKCGAAVFPLFSDPGNG